MRVRERNPRRGKDADNALIYRSPQQMELQVSDHWMGRSFSTNKAYSLRDILQPSFSNPLQMSLLSFTYPPPPRLPKTGQAHYAKHDKEHVCLCLPFEAHNLRNKNLQRNFFPTLLKRKVAKYIFLHLGFPKEPFSEQFLIYFYFFLSVKKIF